MGILNEVKQISDAAGGSFRIVLDTVKKFSFNDFKAMDKAMELPLEPPGMFEEGVYGFFKHAVVKPLTWGLKVAEVPITIMLKPLKLIAAAPGAFFKSMPRAAPVLTIGAAAVGVGSWYSRRQSEKLHHLQNEYMASAMQAQEQPSYMNSVLPQEMADIDARIAAGQAPASPHVDAVLAARQNTAETKTAEAAAL